MQDTTNTNSLDQEQRKLAAIMFADMMGYTAMMQEDEAQAKYLRTRQRKALETIIPEHHGIIIQYFGDGTLSMFDSSSDAVRCGIAIQNELQKEPRVKLRIGIHSGDVVYNNEGIFGDCVNLASRIESLSVPGAVLFSGKVNDEIKNQRDIKTTLIGKFHLKNVKVPVDVFASANDGMVIPLLSEISGKTEPGSNSFFSLFKKKSVRLIAFAVAAVILILTAATLFSLPEKNNEIDSIAVLPLENISGNPEQEYFVSGMHETLITELSKISSLKIISRTSTLQYKDTKKTMPEIAKELGVKALIEGSVIREGNMIRITVQLIDGKSDKHIWAKEFNQEMKGILALFSDVAKQIAGEIKIKLTPQDNERLITSQEVNTRAYELYLLGRHFWNQRTVQSYKQAIEYYKNALEFDAGYTIAYAALAEGYTFLAEQGGMAQKDARHLADSSIKKALRLNENLAEAHAAKGIWEIYNEWNWVEAEKSFKRAIELNPGYAITYQYYGRMLGYIDRYDESLVLLKKAKELDPLSPIIAAYTGQVYLFSKRYKKADEEFQQALKTHPNHALILHNIGELYLALGRYEEAIAPLKISAEMSVSVHYQAMLGNAYALANRKDEAREILKKFLNQSDSGLTSGFNLAVIYVALGEKEQALSQLEQGFEQHDVWMKELKAWPWFDTLKNEPRYKNLIRRMNFPE